MFGKRDWLHSREGALPNYISVGGRWLVQRYNTRKLELTQEGSLTERTILLICSTQATQLEDSLTGGCVPSGLRGSVRALLTAAVRSTCMEALNRLLLPALAFRRVCPWVPRCSSVRPGSQAVAGAAWGHHAWDSPCLLILRRMLFGNEQQNSPYFELFLWVYL